VGDRLTEEEGEWEVDTHPAALHGGKSLHERPRKVDEPAVVRYVTWSVHERVTVQRRRLGPGSSAPGERLGR
jgi:hypothetical protein